MKNSDRDIPSDNARVGRRGVELSAFYSESSGSRARYISVFKRKVQMCRLGSIAVGEERRPWYVVVLMVSNPTRSLPGGIALHSPPEFSCPRSVPPPASSLDFPPNRPLSRKVPGLEAPSRRQPHQNSVVCINNGTCPRPTQF